MPRLIDADAFKRQAAVETVRHNLDVARVMGFCALIDMQPTIDPGEQIHWVPCAERMPPEPEPYWLDPEYLVTTDNGEVSLYRWGYTSTRPGARLRRWEDVRGRTRVINQPIAWAELPEPWKERKPHE